MARDWHDSPQRYALRPDYRGLDAERKFSVADVTATESPLCISGQIMRGLKKPHQCSAFGTVCNPEHPLGAPMVSPEGGLCGLLPVRESGMIAMQCPDSYQRLSDSYDGAWGGWAPHPDAH